MDNDIRNDWLEAMRSSQDEVVTCYDMVINRMAATPPVHFESPGDLGPGLQPLPAPPEAPPVTATATPAAATAPTGTPANPVAAQGRRPGPSAAMPATPAPDVGSPLGDMSALPAGAGGLGGLGDMGAGSGAGGLGGLASRIVDAMTGLLGSADGLSDPSGPDDSAHDEDPFDDDDASDDDPFHPDDEHHDAEDAQQVRGDS